MRHGACRDVQRALGEIAGQLGFRALPQLPMHVEQGE